MIANLIGGFVAILIGVSLIGLAVALYYKYKKSNEETNGPRC